MTLCLLLLTPELEPPLFVELESRKIIIGRSEQARVCLPDLSINRQHCSLSKRGQQYLLVDDGSARGTAILQEKEWIWLSPRAPRVIACGTIFRAGDIRLQVVIKKKARECLDAKGKTEQLPLDLVGTALHQLGGAPSQQEVLAALTEILEHPEPKPHLIHEENARAVASTPPKIEQPISGPRSASQKFFKALQADSSWDLLIFLLILAILGSLSFLWYWRQGKF